MKYLPPLPSDAVRGRPCRRSGRPPCWAGPSGSPPGSNTRSTSSSTGVLVAAVVGGFGPGLVATALAVLAATLFASPHGSFAVDSPADRVRLALFAVEGVAISGLGAALDSARRRIVPPGWPRYAVAVGAVLAATAVKVPLLAFVGDGDTPFLLFYAAVLAAAWLGGPRSGLVATGLAAVAGDLLFMTPRYTFHIDTPVQAVQLAAFVAEGVLISFFSTVGHAAWAEAERARDRATEAEGHFRRLVGSIRDYAVFTLDAGGAVASWNSGAERLTGYPTADAIGRPFADLLPENAGDRGADVLRASARGFPPPQWFVRRDGTRFRAEASVAAADGGFSVVLRDVSERARLEDQLRQSQKLEATGRLAGGVAHDFNNLITVILGCTDLALLELPPGSTAAAEHLAEVRGAADRAAALTRQLLAFGRRGAARPQAVDLNALLGDSRVPLARTSRDRSRVDWRPAPGPVRVWVDPGQLAQVVENLVANARDASPPGGLVVMQTLASADMPGRPTDAGPLAPGRYGGFAVADRGDGMAADVRSRLFEPFFTTKPGRSGLGLATVFGVVRQAGGGIDVDTRPGKGTTFTVWLPAVDGADGPAPVAREAGGETVLVVEDQSAIRALTCMVLRDAGYVVLSAAGGGEAERVAGEGAIDLLVTDVRMPGVSGPELARRLRSDRPGLRVLFVSGGPDADAERTAGGRFLFKPFTSDALTRAVRAALDG